MPICKRHGLCAADLRKFPKGGKRRKALSSTLKSGKIHERCSPLGFVWGIVYVRGLNHAPESRPLGTSMFGTNQIRQMVGERWMVEAPTSCFFGAREDSRVNKFRECRRDAGRTCTEQRRTCGGGGRFVCGFCRGRKDRHFGVCGRDGDCSFERVETEQKSSTSKFSTTKKHLLSLCT